MLSVNGYYDGNGYVTEGNVAVKTNQKVIITLLDDYVPVRPHRSISEIKAYKKKKKKSVPDGISTVDYIRQLREEA